MVAPDERGDVGGKRVGRQRPRGDDEGKHRRVVRDAWNLLPDQRDQRVPLDGAGDRLREQLAIDRKRGAGRHAVRIGGAHHERSEPTHLLLEQADGVIELVAAQ